VVASPDGSGPWPGVVIVHDMVSSTSGGLPGIIDRVADAGHLVDCAKGRESTQNDLRYAEGGDGINTRCPRAGRR
jgi:dienelactone hydrolase